MIMEKLDELETCHPGQYMQRSRFWVPRDAECFGDGGSFPECVSWQYPLNMGNDKHATRETQRDGLEGRDFDREKGDSPPNFINDNEGESFLYKHLERLRLDQDEREDVLCLDEVILDAGKSMLMHTLKTTSAPNATVHDSEQHEEHSSAFEFLRMCRSHLSSSSSSISNVKIKIIDSLRAQCSTAGMKSKVVEVVRNLSAEEIFDLYVYRKNDFKANKEHTVVGQPIVVGDGIGDWRHTKLFNVNNLVRDYGDEDVIVNDRAPARHADSFPNVGASSSKQSSVRVRLRDYVDYVKARSGIMTSMLTQSDPRASCMPRPFYLNGWRIFQKHENLLKLFPSPRCVARIDHTHLLLKEMGQIFEKGISGKKNTEHVNEKDKFAWSGIANNLQKIFVGCAGCVTRMHYDSGDAHGWLAQVQGSKLYILFSPDDSCHIKTSGKATESCKENQTKRGGDLLDLTQSFVDPLLHPHRVMSSLSLQTYRDATMYITVLQPGQLLIIPKGWWHYALCLDDDNVTVMRNFYNASTNASGLVKMALDAINK